MNYLRNQFMFKFFSNIFRLAKKSSEDVQNLVLVGVKRNRSDSLMCVKSAEDKECQTVKHKSEENLSKQIKKLNKKSSNEQYVDNSSNVISNASSEHSLRCALDKKKSFVDLQRRGTHSYSPERTTASLNRELKSKLKKLTKSLENKSSEENLIKPKLKRSYPWQNYNLNTVLKEHIPEKLPKVTKSDISLINLDSDTSMRSISKVSTLSSNSDISLTSRHSREGSIVQQSTKKADSEPYMPLYKSILKKTAQDQETLSKQVKFSSPATVYYPSPTAYSSVFHQTKTHLSTGNIQTKHPMVKNINTSIQQKLRKDNESLKILKKSKSPPKEEPRGKCEPIKEELSFLYLYNGKKQKIH